MQKALRNGRLTAFAKTKEAFLMQNNNKKAALAAVMCMAMAVPFAANAENETRVITCGTLNLRAEASTESEILGKYGWGTEVEVLGFDGKWAYVEVGGQNGYMFSQYLGSEDAASYTAYIKTNSRGLNLRHAPDGDILGSYPRGTKVTVLSSENGWSKVTVDGKTGYMMAKYLKVQEDIHSGTATVYNPNGNSYVNFRKSASLNSTVLAHVPVGTKIDVIEKGTDWTKTQIDGVTGYISTWFLKF